MTDPAPDKKSSDDKERIPRSQWLSERNKRINQTALDAMDDPAVRWFVADVRAQHEFAVQVAFRAWGLHVYVPTWSVTRRRGRSKNSKTVLAPFISRCMFIGVHGDDHPVFDVFRSGLARSANDKPGALVGVSGERLKVFVTEHPIVTRADVSKIEPHGLSIGDHVWIDTDLMRGIRAEVSAVRPSEIDIFLVNAKNVKISRFPVDRVKKIA